MLLCLSASVPFCSYRLYRIFNQREIKTITISDWNVLSVVIGVLACELAILITFQIMSPLTVQAALMDTEQAWSYTCKFFNH